MATGTDVKPLEVLIFLNDVHSETLYTQMKGRGVRTISPSQLRAVTPNAVSKDLFFLIDAVGVTESEKFVPQPGGRELLMNPSLEQLFEKMSLGYLPDDYFQLLAGKLSCIGNRADPEELAEYAAISSVSPVDWARIIMETLDKGDLPPFVSASKDNTARMDVVRDLLTNIPARKKLVEMARGYIKEILGKKDTVISVGFSTEEAQASTAAFEKYVNEHRDELESLRLIYNQESGKLTRPLIDELTRRLEESLPGFRVGRLWNDYSLLEPTKVKPLSSDQEAVTNLIQLVRFAYKQIDTLYSLTSMTAQRFELWCGQTQRKIVMTPEQKELFRKIAVYIAYNGSCDFKTIRRVMPDMVAGMLRFCSTAGGANEHIFSLNEFILKAA